SVGIMLFELLTGRLPFDADSPLAIAYAHVQEEPPQPSSVNRSLPPAVDALVARTLRKNPNERFPSAETMHDECLRVGGPGVAGGAPVIVSGGPGGQSGAGFGQAVFPPVGDAGTPPPHGSVQQPYQPQQQYGGFGPSTPPPPSQNPMGQYPTGSPYGVQQGGGSHTPPPYTLSPSPSSGGGRGGGKNNTPVIVGSAVAAIVVVAALIIALTLNSGGDDDPPADSKSSASASAKATDEPASGGDSAGEFKPEDKSKTIETTRCTEASDSYSDKSKKILPDFTYRNLSSVKQCIREAGWKLGEITYEDENIWGKNMVLDQDPDGIDEFDPEKDEIELTVSTGKPAD
ncbi:MAG: PASTA domain-containing protein, partial [Streptomyces sp.]|uniref:PASTA domain-containing protein n=1 Tax=Streptomyces sp. TaxID=1931 RepID=UPI003D6B9EA8